MKLWERRGYQTLIKVEGGFETPLAGRQKAHARQRWSYKAKMVIQGKAVACPASGLHCNLARHCDFDSFMKPGMDQIESLANR